MSFKTLEKYINFSLQFWVLLYIKILFVFSFCKQSLKQIIHLSTQPNVFFLCQQVLKLYNRAISSLKNVSGWCLRCMWTVVQTPLSLRVGNNVTVNVMKMCVMNNNKLKVHPRGWQPLKKRMFNLILNTSGLVIHDNTFSMDGVHFYVYLQYLIVLRVFMVSKSRKTQP